MWKLYCIHSGYIALGVSKPIMLQYETAYGEVVKRYPNNAIFRRVLVKDSKSEVKKDFNSKAKKGSHSELKTVWDFFCQAEVGRWAINHQYCLKSEIKSAHMDRCLYRVAAWFRHIFGSFRQNLPENDT